MKRKPRIFRVFISSTFEDLKAERNALYQKVFPRLKALCLQHGTRFQAIDLRWGISEEASLNQETMLLCLNEVRRCKELSPKPNFLILLGDRYGWRPLPSEIPDSVFQHILEKIADPEEINYLKNWYRMDLNAIPPVWCLIPRTGLWIAQEQWNEAESRLGGIIRRGVSDLKEHECYPYISSATDQEIALGVFEEAGAADHVHAFFRTVEDLPEHSVSSFTSPEEEPNRLICELKEKLRISLGQNVQEYKVKYTGSGITYDHLEPLCQDVYASLSKTILEEIAALEQRDSVEAEVAEHDSFGRLRALDFIGRKTLLDTIYQYVAGISEPGVMKPLVLHGMDGSGKTALLAKASENLTELFSDAWIITRFIGETPLSLDKHTLFDSLYRQLCRLCNRPPSSQHRDFQELATHLKEMVSEACHHHRVVILLDDIDRIFSDEDFAGSSLIPFEPDRNFRLVLSMSSENFTRLGSDNFYTGVPVRMMDMDLQECREYLEQKLRKINRCLQPLQYAYVMDCFAHNRQPLYLTLVLQDVGRWRSFEDCNLSAAGKRLVGGTEDQIRRLLENLCSVTNHGPILVSHFFKYLACSKCGLTEDEILELLSNDDEVMQEFRLRFPKSPRTGMLPVVVWARLFQDVRAYLSESSRDGTILIQFFHTSVHKMVREMFLSGSENLRYHGRLAEFFMKQRLEYEKSLSTIYNLRKLSELPYQLTMLHDWTRLRDVLFDLDFMYAKLQSFGVFSLIEDIHRSDSMGMPGMELKKVGDALRSTAHILDVHPEELPGQLIRKLQFGESTILDGFIRTVLSWRKIPWLCPLNPPRQAGEAVNEMTLTGHADWIESVTVFSGGEYAASCSDDGIIKVWNLNKGNAMLSLKGHSAKVRDIKSVPDGKLLLSASDDSTIKVWDLRKGKEIRTLKGHQGGVGSLAVSSDGRFVVSGSDDGTVKIWDIAGGRLAATLAGHTDWVRGVALSPDNRFIASVSDDAAVKLWDFHRRSLICTFTGHERTVWGVAFTPDGLKIVTSSYDKTVRIWDLSTKSQLAVIQAHGDFVRGVAVTPDGKYIVSSSEDHTVKLWDTKTLKNVFVLNGHSAAVWSVAVTPDGKRVLSGSGDRTVRIWNITEQKAMHHSSGSFNTTGVAINAGGDRCVSISGDAVITLWDAKATKKINSFRDTCHTALDIAMTPDGQKAVTALFDHTLNVWDLHSGSLLHSLKAHTDQVNKVLVTPGGKVAISASKDASISIWNLETGDELFAINAHGWAVSAVCLSQDAKYIFSASRDGEIKRWDLSQQKGFLVAKDLPIVWSMDSIGPTTIAAGCDDGTLRILDWETQTLLQTIPAHEKSIRSVRKVGIRFVTASDDGFIKIWSAEGREIAGYALEEQTACLAVSSDSSDSSIIVCGGEEGYVHFCRFIK